MAVSVMFWLFAKPSVTVAVRSFRVPPVAVTSYTVEAVTSLTDSAAVVPLTVKSAWSTFATFSLNVTRQIRLFALVGELEGLWRSIEVTRGAVLSRATETAAVAALVRISVVLPSSVKVTFTLIRRPPARIGARDALLGVVGGHPDPLEGGVGSVSKGSGSPSGSACRPPSRSAPGPLSPCP